MKIYFYVILEPEVEVDVFRYNKDYMEQSEVSWLLTPPPLKKTPHKQKTQYAILTTKFCLCNAYIYLQSCTEHIVYLTCTDYLKTLYMSLNKH